MHIKNLLIVSRCLFFYIPLISLIACAGPGYDAGNDVIAQERNLYQPLGAKINEERSGHKPGSRGCVFGSIHSTDAVASPITGAEIKLYENDELFSQTLSDSQGRYHYCAPKNRRDDGDQISLRITVMHPKYKTKEHEQQWDLSKALPLDLRLDDKD